MNMIVCKIFFCFFLSLLTGLIVKSSHILIGTYFIFLGNVLDQGWKVFNIEFGLPWKDSKSSYQVRQILALFCQLVALILD